MNDPVIIRFTGHADIRATDPRTIEVLDSDAYAARPGVIGYAALFDPAAVGQLRGRVRATIACSGVEDHFEATISPLFSRGASLTLRRDPAARPKSFAQSASKSSADLKRELIAALRARDASGSLTLDMIGETMPPPGALFLVAMPIGRQDDLSPRALDVLMSVDAIYAEDTRVAQEQLSWRGVRTPLISCHDHSERARADEVAARLARGERVAFVSDAGAPLVSDPGALLVRAALAVDACVTTAPGPSAVIAALTVSGIAGGAFTFAGFPPRGGRERSAFLDALIAGPSTQILFESPHRLKALLADLTERAPTRMAALCRDLTKQSETVKRSTLQDLFRLTDAEAEIRGEYVLVLAGSGPTAAEARTDAADLDEFICALIDSDCPTAPIVKALRAVSGLDRSAAYERVAALKETRAKP